MPVKMPSKTPPAYTEHLFEDVSAKSGEGTVVIEKKVGGEDYVVKGASSESPTPPLVHDKSGEFHIEVTGGRTINTGNYESARISVSIRMPCDKNTLNDAYEFATNWVNSKIEEATKVI